MLERDRGNKQEPIDMKLKTTDFDAAGKTYKDQTVCRGSMDGNTGVTTP